MSRRLPTTMCLLFFFFPLFLLPLQQVFASEEESAVGKTQQEDMEMAHGFDSSSCGKSKGCLMKPNNCTPHKDCTYAMSFLADGERVYFELLGQITAGQNAYVALGFSVDGLMGGDTVTDCSSFDDAPFSARLSYNPGKSNRKVPLDDQKMGQILTSQSAHFMDGTLYCRFSQLIQPPAWFLFSLAGAPTQFARSYSHVFGSDPEQRQVFDQTFHDSSETTLPELTIHSLDAVSSMFPFSSPAPVQLTAYTVQPSSPPNGTEQPTMTTTTADAPPVIVEQPADTTEHFLVKAHGVLMLLSWLLLAPFAILCARFLRSEPTQVLGLQLWFQVHRTANCLTFLLVLISLLCILSASKGEWLGPTDFDDLRATSLHALFGAFGIALTVCQPLIALFRCAPASPARPIFNWLHSILGYTAWLFSAIAVSIACFHPAFNHRFLNPFRTRDLLIAALALVIVSFSALQWFSVLRARSQQQNQGHKGTANDQQREGLLIKRAILGLFLVVGTALSLALCLLLLMKGPAN